MKYQAIQSLHDGPIDIVGDVHGEITALNALIGKLGYTQDGRHPHGRRLVFVGDLVDRGEDSPAMVERVAGLVQAGRAQCVLGNRMPPAAGATPHHSLHPKFRAWNRHIRSGGTARAPRRPWSLARLRPVISPITD